MAKFTPNKYNIGKVQLALLSAALVGGKWTQIPEKERKAHAFCWTIVLATLMWVTFQTFGWNLLIWTRCVAPTFDRFWGRNELLWQWTWHRLLRRRL